MICDEDWARCVGLNASRACFAERGDRRPGCGAEWLTPADLHVFLPLDYYSASERSIQLTTGVVATSWHLGIEVGREAVSRIVMGKRMIFTVFVIWKHAIMAVKKLRVFRRFVGSKSITHENCIDSAPQASSLVASMSP